MATVRWATQAGGDPREPDFYSYDVRGVEYTASQDISRFTVPTGFFGLGAVCVKYDPRNPANSIVVAEEWSGLRGRHASPAGEPSKPLIAATASRRTRLLGVKRVRVESSAP